MHFAGGASVLDGGIGLRPNCASSRRDAFVGGVPVGLAVVKLGRRVEGEVDVQDRHGV